MIFWLFLLSEASHNLQYFLIVFNKTIIPLALVGYEMIIANSALRASLAIYHLISNARSWNNCQIMIADSTELLAYQLIEATTKATATAAAKQ